MSITTICSPRGVKLQTEDVWGRVRFCAVGAVLDPQFQGQTKEKLNNRDALKLVASLVRDPLEIWLNAHVDHARKIAELAIRQAQSRLKSVKKSKRKRLRRGGAARQADRLRKRRHPAQRAVSGGRRFGRRSAKLARDKEYQAILPLRGKVLNSWKPTATNCSRMPKSTTSPSPSA